jgi:hypothetical protein
MPSHSKKQHNFMEAIAHSPSFAKKAGVPQSVGKDYVAADKGKTFRKGGNMKKMAEGGMSEADRKEMAEYRKKPSYHGYEDYSPSGRAAIRDYNKNENPKRAVMGIHNNYPVDPVALKKSQSVQREVMNEGRRETRGTVPAEALKKGGEVKESKAMVGKEMSFMKKKGAPKSMIKHEEAEMKGMKRGGKVRRMAEGGDTDMSMGFGDPFAKSRDYDKEKAQGADSLKRLKGFFGFGDKEEKPSMTMDRPSSGSGIKLPTAASASSASTSDMPPPPSSGGRKPLPPVKNPESDDSSGKAKGPQFQNSVMDRGEGEYSGDGLSPAQGYKPSSISSASRKPKEVSVEKEKTKVTASPGYKRSGATAEELERYAGPFRVTESANKMRKEVEDKIRDSKPGSMTKQMRDAPSISDLYKGQKSMGEEIGDALKSFRASIRGGLKSAKEKRETREAEASAAKGGQVKRMRYGGDTGMDMGQPMRGSAPPPPAPRGMPMPAAGPEMNPNSIAYLQSKYGMRPQGGPPMKAGGSVKKMAEGGFTREADGVAKKGKTQGKVVKMASGGFVKTADGCAQRGKTKAFQVKMKNGGMC